MLVAVEPYRHEWPTLFQAEAKKLRDVLGEIVVEIHHIGSTAVPGLMAKPIIDILPEVTDLAILDGKKEKMEGLGYEVMGELGIIGRRYFRKGGYYRTHQIHAFQTGDPHIIRHLAFRDYLIAHPAVAAAYGQLKLDIALRCNNDIDRYCAEKDPFIAEYEQIALRWYDEAL